LNVTTAFRGLGDVIDFEVNFKNTKDPPLPTATNAALVVRAFHPDNYRPRSCNFLMDSCDVSKPHVVPGNVNATRHPNEWIRSKCGQPQMESVATIVAEPRF
jgi:hypothetical protein